ncbi:MAG: Undecaprenyl-phosphate 4-deoxy-4-formamido-L-arabinose transferase [Candidatus Woesebacteria bacterium GW2011_GWB1_45_5]|uniref:Undecaprenyl-phosphate 4-deoxy-4-formamido-L-arabinose transferase n=1 Tax=Candidatus Woesebacteria bacterium GW2011_GWB1_45_5 TaxID=1618581 RepID=A0A0G1PZN0_9BACT|nr:MAG: Undecaprenyl-phosphate 4-deoxy-4-formamido-L-arabinose transferase [Candidatus Woesebacteria bacterium GW2011_GWB1_45_5]
MSKDHPDISIVVPAKDEERSIVPLFNELGRVLKSVNKTHEIIFVDDGSTDKTLEAMKDLRKKDKRVKIISLRGCFGKSIALQSGFDHAEGDIVITMDADLQDDPREIPRFLTEINRGYDLVSGWKKLRHDPLNKKLPSKIGNWLARFLTGVKIHDLNSGFKAYRREVVKNLNLYGELYKFIPVIAQNQNYKVGEIVVAHRRRKYGKSKYGWQRNIKGILDLFTVAFLSGYLRRPGHFFGTIGLGSFSAGFAIGLYITYLRLTTGTIQSRQPLLFLGVLLMVVGVQLVTTGLLAELFVNLSSKDDTGEKIKQTYL